MPSFDLLVVPTISFRLLYGLLVLGHGRRRTMWLGVTAHPTAEWIARQITEACGWEEVPTYLVRDRDCVTERHLPDALERWAFATLQGAASALRAAYQRRQGPPRAANRAYSIRYHRPPN